MVSVKVYAEELSSYMSVVANCHMVFNFMTESKEMYLLMAENRRKGDRGGRPSGDSPTDEVYETLSVLGIAAGYCPSLAWNTLRLRSG